jgi:hypothetical protein
MAIVYAEHDMDDVRKAKRGEVYCSELFKSYHSGILPHVFWPVLVSHFVRM